MRNVTLCYIEENGKYLMLHRTKKENDINKDKWIGVGGKFEDKESPEECVRREVKEETGLTLNSCKLRSIVTFVSSNCETEYMYIFTSNDFSGELIECTEGELKWIDKEKIMELNLWEGDKVFLDRIKNENYPFFTAKLEYEDDKLVYSKVNEY